MHLFIHSYDYNFSYFLILLKNLKVGLLPEKQECTEELKLSFNSFFASIS
jgi:hypothetical protein